VADSCVVLIASPVLLPALKKRLADEGEICDFTDVDALRALETIIRRRPPVIALERAFAATPRGAALIARIQADPSLAAMEIRIVAPDGASSRPSAGQRAEPGRPKIEGAQHAYGAGHEQAQPDEIEEAVGRDRSSRELCPGE